MNRFLRSFSSKSVLPKFQVVSDLHLEVGQQYNTYKIPPRAPYLILGGDIGRLVDYEPYLRFLESHKAGFEQIFLVLGNHEFYGLSHAIGLEQAQRLQAEPTLDGKMTLLDQTRFDVPDSSIIILGCTLWSRVPDDAMPVVQTRINDFQRISGWTVEDHNKAFELDYAWLKREVTSLAETEPASCPKVGRRTTLIVTHHAPLLSGTSHPTHEKNPWSSAFATDILSAHERWSNVGVWIFGHTHFTTDFARFGVRLFSNQRGYVFPGNIGAARSSGSSSGKESTFDVTKTLRV